MNDLFAEVPKKKRNKAVLLPFTREEKAAIQKLAKERGVRIRTLLYKVIGDYVREQHDIKADTEH